MRSNKEVPKSYLLPGRRKGVKKIVIAFQYLPSYHLTGRYSRITFSNSPSLNLPVYQFTGSKVWVEKPFRLSNLLNP
jgi:hypothetical protein